MSVGPDALVVAHHHPGRLRVRARVLEQDTRVMASVHGALSGAAGVIAVRGRAETGSVLVEYDPTRTDAGRLLERIAGVTRLPVARPTPRRLAAQPVFDAARDLDGWLSSWTRGRIDLRVGVPMALGLGSVLSFFWSGQPRAPRWETLLFWSVNLLMRLNDDAGDEAAPRSHGLH
ncbi:MAG TPA: hypothetical protein VE987_02445 [Polyangiaceae bacterium]|nr:hypothetical protein [Polyangiaceae bacterium]